MSATRTAASPELWDSLASSCLNGESIERAVSVALKGIALGGIPHAPTDAVMEAAREAYGTGAEPPAYIPEPLPLNGEVGDTYVETEAPEVVQGGKGLRLPAWEPVRAADPPRRAPELIGGILRRGHTGMITGRAKSNKTWAGIALCVAVSMGGLWMGFPCSRGSCLYIDPEVDPLSLDNRFHKVAEAMGADFSEVDARVRRWSLRGVVKADGSPPTIVDVAHDLESHISSGGIDRATFDLVVVDSCSALLQGDENASTDVRRYHSYLLRIARLLDASVVFVQHEGKTQSGDMDAMSRGRGSSAWGDCPDLVLSLVETFPPSGEQSDYLGEGERSFMLECAGIREFKAFESRRLIYSYPAFRLDAGGVTEDWKPKSGQRDGGKGSGETRKLKAEARASRCVAAILAHIYQNDIGDEGISSADAVQVCSDALGDGISASTLKRYVGESDLLDVYQRSPKRCHFVPRKPRHREEQLL